MNKLSPAIARLCCDCQKDARRYWKEGHVSVCHGCYWKRWKKANRDKFIAGRERLPTYNREYWTARRKRRALENRLHQKKYREKNQEKRAAHRMLRGAINSGTAQKPSMCVNCGKIPSRLHGHHHKGYTLPLEVKWLCPKCHKKEHEVI